MPWAILLGALVSVLGWAPPKSVAQTVGLLADAASPVALFTLLWHPLLVLLVGGALISQDVPPSRFALALMVLTAGLPNASNVSLLAERFGADNGRIARIILVSMAAAFVTFSLSMSLPV